MTLPPSRPGVPLAVTNRRLEFSPFMMRRGASRWGVNSMLYASEPWAVLDGAVADALNANDREAAHSFVRQAREYFLAADRAGAVETRPLLYYYSFLNLAKALAMVRGRSGLVGKVSHGVAVVGGATTGRFVSTAKLQFENSAPGKASALDELHHCIEGGPAPTAHASVSALVAQSVVAHRLWKSAANRKERFLRVTEVGLRHDPTGREIWATIQVSADMMRVRGRTISETLQEAGLAPTFRAVGDSIVNQTVCRVFEQTTPVAYADRPSDQVMEVVASVRPILWQAVTSAPPYRRYYVYLCPPAEMRHPQWYSIYLVMFWLGSLTRYQPVELLQALGGPYGPFFHEFIATQPTQLLYLLASEFMRQDVSKAAVV